MKVFDPKSLNPDRLATTDEEGWRIHLFPQHVKGFYRKWRDITQAILIVIFLVAPWIKINGTQSILINIPDRQFAFFGLTFWAHDTPILFFLLLIATIGLAFVTAIWGRVWCGWACPQTVFIDGVFRRIERLVEGSSYKQMQLAKAPLSLEKISKLSIKWLLFILAGLIISHSFLAYFVGADNLWPMITSDPKENWGVFSFMAAFTAITLFDFTWFREQFCIIMCPYGRIQSVLMDDKSLAVIYDENRGEPRKAMDVAKEDQGDCVDCGSCVRACPTGIDIRHGVQLECIACTACIDACDDVMKKVQKPKGLIRYDSQSALEGKKRNIFSLRFFIYSSILLVAFSGLIISVANKNTMDITLLRGHDSPYTKASEENLYLNHYKLVIKNRTFNELEVFYEISKTENDKMVELIAPQNPMYLKAGAQSRAPFFIKFHKDFLVGERQKTISLKFISKTEEINKKVSVIGPNK